MRREQIEAWRTIWKHSFRDHPWDVPEYKRAFEQLDAIADLAIMGLDLPEYKARAERAEIAQVEHSRTHDCITPSETPARTAFRFKVPLKIQAVPMDDITTFAFIVDADGLTVSKDDLVAAVNDFFATRTEKAPANEIDAEVARAVAKFPTWPTDPLHALAVLGEEFGELTKAMLQFTYEPHKTSREEIREEAIQTAAMALRLYRSLGVYDYKPGVQHRQSEGDRYIGATLADLDREIAND